MVIKTAVINSILAKVEKKTENKKGLTFETGKHAILTAKQRYYPEDFEVVKVA